MSSSSVSRSIVPVTGFTPEVGRLVGMLTYARMTTLRAVRGLSDEQLDHRHDEQSNSIGMLLAHIAALERVYQIETFEQRDPSVEEQERWGPAVSLGPSAWQTIRGRRLQEYVGELEAIRDQTLAALREVDDAWLDQAERLPDGSEFNWYWCWFHVFEDELNHRGQIRWLRARLPSP